MSALRLHDIPYELVPREVPLLLVLTPAGFPSAAQDDMQEAINLGSWLIELTRQQRSRSSPSS